MNDMGPVRALGEDMRIRDGEDESLFWLFRTCELSFFYHDKAEDSLVMN